MQKTVVASILPSQGEKCITPFKLPGKTTLDLHTALLESWRDDYHNLTPDTDMANLLNKHFEVMDSRSFDLFCGAFDTGLQYVRRAEAGKSYIGTHENWPEIEYHENNGLPYVKSTGESPKDYGGAIQFSFSAIFGLRDDEPPLDFRKEPTFISLIDYAKTEPRLKQYLLFDFDDYGTTKLVGVVAYALDRYVNTN
jgi:hypothetical protein